MASKTKSIVTVVIITAIMILYFAIYFGVLIRLVPSLWKYVLGVFPLVFSGVMLKVSIERINEIKKGEQDDISKY